MVQYDPKECSYEALLDVFWSRHDPTTLNRQEKRKFKSGAVLTILITWLQPLQAPKESKTVESSGNKRINVSGSSSSSSSSSDSGSSLSDESLGKSTGY
ncbi:hypothetical protein LOK49_LG05G02494 [Camellia lanceoleosa]|uniref:Uncharacterized protein n=1 Tax=Camellia lanceoleosa TaxID=1840588 RepID=A0ACC0HHL7_9ERIC|nr:hypothetical protein LOK49_LG05G02494 [Camellia lanceoleosa]